MSAVVRSGTTDRTRFDVLAAGAVLWRRGTHGVELGLVHRPSYDDWSFPKGKLDPDETLPFAAAREVTEETGQRVRLGPVLGDVHYRVPEGDKLVRYWAAESCGGDFVANGETDELRWVDVAHAAEMLSYRRDIDVLRRFAAIGTPASTVLLARHAKAGNRDQWDGEDALRPLSGTGHEQAQRLARLLALFGPDRIASASPVRCRDTVAPLAAALDIPILDVRLLGEDEFEKEPEAGLARFRELAAEPGVTVACSQGGVIPHLISTLATGSGVAGVDPDDVQAKKASTWTLTFGPDAGLRTADYYARPKG